MAVLNFTLSEEAVAALRDVLNCLNKFSDDVSLEARRDQLVLSTLNSSKSAYACFTLATSRFFSRYQFEGNAQYRDKFYCKLYIRALMSIFRSRTAGDPRDRDRETSIDRCDVAIQDGPNVKSRFIVKLVFRNGITSTHKLSFESLPPTRANFNKDEAVHHWSIPSRTLRQLIQDHIGPGIEYLEVNSDGEHVNFIGFTEKIAGGDEVLKKPLHTSIAVEVDEFDDIEVEEKLRIVISVKDFRAIISHAGSTGNHLTARYSTPAKPISFTYQGDGFTCEFLLMTVGERGNPGQKTKKGKANGGKAARQQQLEAAAGSRRQSAAPSEPPDQPPVQSMPPPPPVASAVRSGAARTSLFDLRPSQMPSQRPPPASMRSEGLFVDDQEWEPVRDEDEEEAEEEARLEWDHSNQPVQSAMHLGRAVAEENGEYEPTPASSAGLEPTQRLSDVRRLGLFYRE